MNDELLRELGVRVPVVQAPMAGVSTPELAAAVSEAGGLGSLGLAGQSPERARASMLRLRELTSRAFGVNVFCHRAPERDPAAEARWLRHLSPLFAEAGAEPPERLAPVYDSFLEDDAMLAVLVETRPAVVSFHFGVPDRDRVRALRDAGVRTLATATSPAEAALIEEAGIDGVVAQGVEAGGHRGVFDPEGVDEALPTAVLTRILVGLTRLPVIAAGGIMDGAGVRAVLDLGAAAAQLGTAFIACPESAASPAHRAALGRVEAPGPRLSRVYSGRPARGFPNEFMEFCERAEAPTAPAFPVAYDANKRLAAVSREPQRWAPSWAGQGAPLARPMPAAELLRRIVAESEPSGAK